MLCHAPQPLNMLAHSPGRLGSCCYAEQTPVYSSKLCTKHCILWQAWLTTTRQNELPQLLIHFNTLLTLPLGEKSYNFKIICFHVKIYNPPLPISSWRRKWQPTTVFLPGESHGQRSLVGCSPWGRTESDTTEATWQGAYFFYTHTVFWVYHGITGVLKPCPGHSPSSSSCF